MIRKADGIAISKGYIHRCMRYDINSPASDMIVNAIKMVIDQGPNSSKLPSPSAVRTTPNKGKQQGDEIAVSSKPTGPIL